MIREMLSFSSYASPFTYIDAKQSQKFRQMQIIVNFILSYAFIFGNNNLAVPIFRFSLVIILKCLFYNPFLAYCVDSLNYSALQKIWTRF